jgi:thioredoxin-dependent peroxiredoxin
MSEITLKGNVINTSGEMLEVGVTCPDFKLTRNDLSEASLAAYKGSRLVLNIFPSLDTGVCAASVRRFNAIAEKLPDTYVLCISADLPFAQARFCGAEGLEKVETLSVYRSGEFGEKFGVEIVDGPMRGLLARAVLVIETDGTVGYSQLVPEIVEEPDYEAVLSHLDS